MQRINFDAIVKNALYFKNILGTSKLCAVLKNNAYGHGLVRTAACLNGVADFIAVGSLQEAVAVRPFCQNVLILLPLFGKDIAAAVENDFVLTVDSFDTLERICANIPCGQKARIHLKLETGMNRLGFRLGELQSFCQRFEGDKLALEGTFSHFAQTTVEACDAQLKAFCSASNLLQSHFGRLTLHIANTAAVLLSPNYHLDMARVGLGLFGYGSEALVPAKTVTAKVVAVHPVFAGECVGYGWQYTFPTNTNVAILNMGYANGFPRVLKNSVVKIGGQLCKTVGNVCMAMMAVDIGRLDVSVGDEAVVLGEGVNNANNDVIVYELLCNLR